jgi:hypothetical protein
MYVPSPRRGKKPHALASEHSLTQASSLRSEDLVKLYRQNLDGGSPQPVASLKAEDTFDFAWPRHGRLLAFMRGNWQHDALIISG